MPIKLQPPGTRLSERSIQVTHPDYDESLERWEFNRHSHELTGGYKPILRSYRNGEQGLEVVAFDETYLVPHEKESNEGFARRVSNSTPPRFVAEGINYITGVLTKQPPNRSQYPDKLSQWLACVNAQNESLQQMIAASIVPLVERYKLCYTLFTRPTVMGANAAEQREKRELEGLPEVIASVINPENVPWWEEDTHGELVALRYTERRIETIYDGDIPVDKEEQTLHWWITLEGYMCAVTTLEGEQPVVLDSGTWNDDGSPMKHLPCTRWRLKGPCPTDAASLSQLKYFRVESVLQRSEYNTAFAMVWIPVESEDTNPVEVVLGDQAVGGFPAEGKHVPMILEPQGNAITHFAQTRLPALEADALAAYGKQQATGGSASGVALAHIQEASNNIFRRHAISFAESESSALQAVAELLGVELPENSRVEWPQEFGTLDTIKQADVLTAFLEAGPGEAYEKHAIRAFADIALPRLTDDDHKEGLDAWESEKEEQKQIDSEDRDMEIEQIYGRPAASNPVQTGGGDSKPFPESVKKPQ